MFGIVEFGRLLWTQNSLQYASEQAARCAVVNTSTCSSTSKIQAYAAGKVIGISVPASAFSVGSASCGTQISASYAFSFILSRLFPYTITLSAAACYGV